jgi:uncharacterized protein YrzB (UPF0473 family)
LVNCAQINNIESRAAYLSVSSKRIGKIMTTKELSEKELEIYRQVVSLQGTMDEKIEKLRTSETFDKYRQIHNQYLTVIKTTDDKSEINEGLKRITFLNWYHIIEPSCFTGIWELDGDTIHDSYVLLNDCLKNSQMDKELEWMLSYYSSNDWTILLYSEKDMPELSSFIKNVDQTKFHLPNKETLTKTMNDRGQMGEYFKSV